jgi:hypothetical protein
MLSRRKIKTEKVGTKKESKVLKFMTCYFLLIFCNLKNFLISKNSKLFLNFKKFKTNIFIISKFINR